MSRWKYEDKEYRQRIYGYYCKMCKENNFNIKPFYDFCEEDFKIIKVKIKESKGFE